ncbi:MAG: response regulator [Deltaproteobacteria bacterium]|nr:response regulator [Deltaproteobacteria bacterium]
MDYKCINVLLIEDNPIDSRLIKEMLTRTKGISCNLNSVEALLPGLALLAKGDIDVLLLDLILPDSRGISTFTQAYANAPDIPIIVLTNLDDEDTAYRAVRHGAQDYLVKGQVDGQLLARSICYAIERKRAQQALRASEEMMRLVIESSPIGMVIAQKSRVLYANPAFVQMFGYTDSDRVIDMPLDKLVDLSDGDLLDDCRRNGSPSNQPTAHFELKGIKENEETFDVDLRLTIIDYHGQPAILGFVIDSSSERKLRAQLFQAQKMEAVGTLAGGVAHDFNNLIQAIKGYTQLLLLDKKNDDPEHEELTAIEQAARRAAELTQQLLTFSRKVEHKFRPVDLNQEVRQVKKLLSRTISKMIAIDLELAEDLKIANADPAQIEQVLMNLAINAQDAMPDGGRIIISTKNVTLDKTFCKTHAEVIPGDYVLIKMTDNGLGMDKNVQNHIFEPFYTTKGLGKGTGLGLSVVYGIIKSHGGYIYCQSALNEGTIFDIYMPAIEQLKYTEEPDVKEMPQGGKETILIVDDEEFIRKFGEKMLRRFGYDVVSASNGHQAIEFYKLHAESISLIILDLIMPEMGGVRCLEEIMKINPQAKVIIASGFPGTDSSEDTIRLGAKSFVSKPYEAAEMLSAIRDVLDDD